MSVCTCALCMCVVCTCAFMCVYVCCVCVYMCCVCMCVVCVCACIEYVWVCTYVHIMYTLTHTHTQQIHCCSITHPLDNISKKYSVMTDVRIWGGGMYRAWIAGVGMIFSPHKSQVGFSTQYLPAYKQATLLNNYQLQNLYSFNSL